MDFYWQLELKIIEELDLDMHAYFNLSLKVGTESIFCCFCLLILVISVICGLQAGWKHFHHFPTQFIIANENHHPLFLAQSSRCLHTHQKHY
jgi:hypothetical protein